MTAPMNSIFQGISLDFSKSCRKDLYLRISLKSGYVTSIAINCWFQTRKFRPGVIYWVLRSWHILVNVALFMWIMFWRKIWDLCIKIDATGGIELIDAVFWKKGETFLVVQYHWLWCATTQVRIMNVYPELNHLHWFQWFLKENAPETQEIRPSLREFVFCE